MNSGLNPTLFSGINLSGVWGGCSVVLEIKPWLIMCKANALLTVLSGSQIFHVYSNDSVSKGLYLLLIIFLQIFYKILPNVVFLIVFIQGRKMKWCSIKY